MPELERPVDYSIVIPAYNEALFLPRTVEGLRRAMREVMGLTGEIIVVDNNSDDGTARIAADRGARVVFEPVNQISRARNRGAEAATGRYLVFVDADTLIPPELLAAALEALEGGQVCGGGALVGSSDSLPRLARWSVTGWNRLSRLFGWAAGSFVFCHHQAWREVGGFSLDFYASEEIHFSRAVAKWGRRRRLEFRILLTETDTSMRKLEWYSPGQMIWLTLRFTLCPWMLRSRRHCGLWYARPNTGDDKEDGLDAGKG